MSWYRAWLRLYPLSFRIEYGDEMTAIFAERWRAARGPRERAALWYEALLDIIWSAPAAHADLLKQDVRTSARSLRQSPGFALATILVAALGIGATTVAFGLIDHVLVRPLPFPGSDRLVKLYQDQSFRGYSRIELSPPNFLDWKREARSFERIAAYTTASVNLVGEGEPLRLDGVVATGDLFSVLGVPAALGRALTSMDDAREMPRVMVLSHRLWTTRFGGSPGVLGRTVRLDDEPHTIVGVMPPHFNFPTREAAFWAPKRFTDYDLEDRTNWYLHGVARLKDDVTLAQARAEMSTIAARLAEAYPDANARNGATVIRLRDEVNRQSRLMLWALAGASICMLLIACTNLASLLLSRALDRHRELAVRAALGAGRERLARQMLTENFVLAAAGGLGGILLAVVGMPLVARLVPTSLPIPDAPALDGRLLALAVEVTVATAIVFGVLPALKLAGSASVEGLKAGARAGASRSTERLRSLLVVGQVTASLVLLVSAGLLIQALWRVQGVAPGFEPTGVLTMRTSLPVPKYETTARRQQFYARVLDEVRAMPGVRQAAYISFLPMVMRGGIWPVTVDGQPEDPDNTHTASMRLITPGFFDTLRIPVLVGRDVMDSDTLDAPLVAIVSQSFAERHWPDQDPLGRHLSLARGDLTVVGVVGDVKVRGLEQESEPQVYLSSAQVPDVALPFYAPRDLVIRADVASESLVPAIRSTIARADSEVPVSDVRSLASVVESETAAREVQVRVLAGFAGMALLLAAVGVHGLLAFSVSARVREIGVRLALGATRARILRQVLARGFLLAGIGVVVGTMGATWAAHVLEALLFGVNPGDRQVYAAAAGVCMLMALAGSLLPALRATRVDPLQAIRAE
ncbi:MAG: ABC transporter permease [Acidobacteria bacterium]|nr:ABC transporter permease [Acidobacteriota bacterium]